MRQTANGKLKEIMQKLIKSIFGRLVLLMNEITNEDVMRVDEGIRFLKVEQLPQQNRSSRDTLKHTHHLLINTCLEGVLRQV